MGFEKGGVYAALTLSCEDREAISQVKHIKNRYGRKYSSKEAILNVKEKGKITTIDIVATKSKGTCNSKIK